MSLYTFTVTDASDLISPEIEAQMTQNAEYVATYISRYINWKGTLDIELKILPISELTWSDADGLLPANGQISWNGSNWTNDTLHEMLTGEDKDISRADAGALIFVPEDGIVQNYGQEVWFDPNPLFEVTPDIPTGKHDFISILTHEIFHTIGFYSVTSEYQSLVVSESGKDLLTGESIVAELGSGLELGSPYSTGPSDHYSSPVGTGLLNQYGVYEQNRWQIGRIDLAVLKDLGHDIKTSEGLATFDLNDQQSELQIPVSLKTFYGDYRSTTLIGNPDDNALFGNGGADTLIDGGGSNTLDGGEGIDTVVLSIPHTQVAIARSDSQLVLTDTVTQNLNILINIERVHFSNKKLAFDLDGHAGETAKIIGVVLGKSGIDNASAVGTALELLDSGFSYEQLMQAALDAVFGPNPESITLINALHTNLTGVSAPDELISQYAPLLNTGALTALELTQAAADLELNAANIDLIGLATTGLEYLTG